MTRQFPKQHLTAMGSCCWTVTQAWKGAGSCHRAICGFQYISIEGPLGPRTMKLSSVLLRGYLLLWYTAKNQGYFGTNTLWVNLGSHLPAISCGVSETWVLQNHQHDLFLTQMAINLVCTILRQSILGTRCSWGCKRICNHATIVIGAPYSNLRRLSPPLLSLYPLITPSISHLLKRSPLTFHLRPIIFRDWDWAANTLMAFFQAIFSGAHLSSPEPSRFSCMPWKKSCQDAAGYENNQNHHHNGCSLIQFGSCWSILVHLGTMCQAYPTNIAEIAWHLNIHVGDNAALQPMYALKANHLREILRGGQKLYNEDDNDW